MSLSIAEALLIGFTAGLSLTGLAVAIDSIRQTRKQWKQQKDKQ